MTMNRSVALTAVAVLFAAFSLQHAAAGDKKAVASTSAAAAAATAVATEVTVVDPKAASELLQSENPPAVLDIRTPDEFSVLRLSGATNIDFYEEDFPDRVAKLDRTKPYLLHCRSGRRTSQALPIFEKLGFRKIYHLNTGTNGWVAAGLPIEK